MEHLNTFHATVAEAHRQFLAQQARAMGLLTALHSGTAIPTHLEVLTEVASPMEPAQQQLQTEAVSATLTVAEPQQQAYAQSGVAAADIAPPVIKKATERAAPVQEPTRAAMSESAQATVPARSNLAGSGVATRPPGASPRKETASSPATIPTRKRRATYPGPALDRGQLEHLASGKISEILGPVFARQDEYVRQVRMPMPPLLLADRVLGIDAVPGAVGQKGVIWTETDIEPDAWYLHNGRIPVGVLIEAGQADLLLVSYLGADFVNKGERVYRLLGCEVTFRAELPQPGDTLHYEIHLDSYAQHVPVRIFFLCPASQPDPGGRHP